VARNADGTAGIWRDFEPGDEPGQSDARHYSASDGRLLPIDGRLPPPSDMSIVERDADSDGAPPIPSEAVELASNGVPAPALPPPEPEPAPVRESNVVAVEDAPAPPAPPAPPARPAAPARPRRLIDWALGNTIPDRPGRPEHPEHPEHPERPERPAIDGDALVDWLASLRPDAPPEQRALTDWVASHSSDAAAAMSGESPLWIADEESDSPAHDTDPAAPDPPRRSNAFGAEPVSAPLPEVGTSPPASGRTGTRLAASGTTGTSRLNGERADADDRWSGSVFPWP
jgi:hypothetical protein